MKKITQTILCFAIFSLFAAQLNAQVGYTYTLVDNGNYIYSIAAVPEISTSNFATSVQSYGFTIIVPDGVTASITSSFGNSAGATFFNGTDVGQPTIDGYLITETLGSPLNLPAPSAAEATPMVTIQVNDMPTSGVLEVLANDSALANDVTPLKSFLTADTTDNGSAEFNNTIPQDTSGLSGTTSSDFATLSANDFQLNNISVFPNPIIDTFNIKSANLTINSVKIYNTNGALVKDINTGTIDAPIDMSDLNTGAYFLELTSGNARNTIKLLKQ